MDDHTLDEPPAGGNSEPDLEDEGEGNEDGEAGTPAEWDPKAGTDTLEGI